MVLSVCLFLMVRRPSGSTRTDTLLPYTSLFRSKALVKLLASVLWRDDGGYWLRTPAEQGRIEVEDAPFTAVELSVKGEGRDQVLAFRTNLDEWVAAGPAHPLRMVEHPPNGDPTPYIEVRDRLEALVLRDRKSTRLNSSH